MKRSSLILFFFIFITFCFYSPAWAGSGSTTETFSTTNFKDLTNTDAAWNTGSGLLMLPKKFTGLSGTLESYDILSGGDTGTSTNPTLRMDPQGYPCIVWQDYKYISTWDNHGDIHFTRWNGTTWTKADKATSGFDTFAVGDVENAHDPFMQVDTNGNPYIVWGDSIPGYDAGVFFTRWNGTKWTIANGTTEGYQCAGPVGSADHPRIALDSLNQYPYILWYANNILYFTRWNGTSWAKADGTAGYESITPASSPSDHQMVLDSQNRPCVIWKDWSSGVGNIYFTRWNGTAWTKADGSTPGYEKLSNNISGYVNSPRLVVDSLNNLHIVWADNTPGYYAVFYDKWTGTAWTKTQITNSSGSSSPQIVLGPSDFPYIVYQDSSTWISGKVLYDVLFTRWNGSSWTKADGVTTGYDNISANSGASYQPWIVLDSQNYPCVMWKDSTLKVPSFDNFDIFFSRWNGSIWTEADKKTPGYNYINTSGNSDFDWGCDASYLGLDAQDQAHMIWRDSTGQMETYYARSSSSYFPASSGRSLKINSAGTTVAQAQLSATENKPLNTDIKYFLSANGGGTWESVTGGDLHVFNTRGQDLRWRVDLSTTDVATTAAVDTLGISYYTSSNAPTIGVPEVLWKDKIRWKFTDNATDEIGFRTYSNHGMTEVALTNLTSIEESSLTANTSYSAYAVAYNEYGESIPSANSAWVYTLPASPDASCNRALNTWYGPGTTYKFTNAAAWGAGSVDHYHYFWNQSPTFSFSGSEDTWNTGTKEMSPSGDGSYYMHLLSHNPAQVSGGNKDIGPYQYDSLAPSAPQSLTSTPASWTNTDSFTLNWTNPSDTSGIAGAYYKLDSVPTSNTDGIYTATPSITQISGIMVITEGTHAVYVWLKDNAGNVNYTSRATTNLRLDTTAPSNPTACNGWSDKNKATVISSGGTYNYSNPYFEWSNASDTNSGVAGYYVYYGTDGAADPFIAGTYKIPASYEVTASMNHGQTYHLRIKTKDSAGNTATDTFEAFSYTLVAESSYTTKVGSNEEWSWRVVGSGEKVTSGTPFNWQWRTWKSVPDMKVPSGEAHDWRWADEITKAELTTTAITGVTTNSASSGGSITSDEGSAVTARGVCWNTGGSPTIADSKTTDGSGMGSFTSSLTSLTGGTTYYVRAYATNSLGTAYGNEVSFTTTYYIGQSYGGGIIFYIDGTGQHGYISAASDQSGGETWSNAVSLCNNLVLNGKDDWFLPDLGAFDLLYAQKAVVGGFAVATYWSSTGFNLPWYAYWKYFGDGRVGYADTSLAKPVRAIRAF